MNKTLQKLLSLCYVLLVIIGMGDLFFHHLVGIWRIIFMTLLMIFTIGMMVVLRGEEDEELKSN